MAYTSFGEFVRILRIKHHEVMGDMAKMLGASLPFLSAVENGKKNEDIEVFMAPDLKRRFSIFESAFGPKITTLSLSPDGRYLLIGKSES